ncbi:MAG: TRAP transporter small permease [Alphaproteobacteria bacterium]|nr:TRAP transporter small permease [Alphaproteobacteria bacterium]
MRLAEKGLVALAQGLALAGAVALAGLFALVLAAVVMRYGWGKPLALTEELSGLLMTAAVFALLPQTILKDVHIRVSIFSERAPEKAAVFVRLLGSLILVAFLAIFAREAWEIADFTRRLNLMSEHARLPLAPFLIFSTLAVGFAGLCGAWRQLSPPPPPDARGGHP